MFDSLGLAYRVLDMSPDELGDPAARKYDIEVRWRMTMHINNSEAQKSIEGYLTF